MSSTPLKSEAMSADADRPPRRERTALEETWTVFRHELRWFLLSPRTILPMVVYAGFGVLAMSVFLFVADRALDEIAQQGVTAELVQEQSEEIVASLLEFSGWGNVGDAAEIFRDRVPLLVLFFFVVASYFLPLLVALVSFDQFSELSTRGARFALLRVRRGTYVAGKAAAAVASVAIFLALTWLVVFAVSIYRGADTVPALRESVRAWVLMTVLALPYLSITAFISAFTRPGLAFLGTLGTWIALSVGSTLVGYALPAMLAERGSEQAAEIARRLLVLFPWEHASLLISRDFGTLLRGIGALLTLAAVGYLATWALVRRRDV